MSDRMICLKMSARMRPLAVGGMAESDADEREAAEMRNSRSVMQALPSRFLR